MKIGIVTVYEPTTNLGSYLQAYALKSFLETLGHDVYIIKNVPTVREILRLVLKINPKREFFLRIKKAFFALKDIYNVKLLAKRSINEMDCVLYGSDEIWNFSNQYFNNGFFWGENVKVPKIAYAVSAGAVDKDYICNLEPFAESVKTFKNVFVRDTVTQDIIKEITNEKCDIVCDPTMLVPLSQITKPAKKLNYKYILVYTYGIDKPMQEYIERFAKENNLKIVSPFFWHIWADEIIECSALNFSDYIKNAEFVFTSTFHGAVFTMLNHKKCCIYPYRPKVKAIVEQMGAQKHLFDDNGKYSDFVSTINRPFDIAEFENKLEIYREFSQKKLKDAIECLKK